MCPAIQAFLAFSLLALQQWTYDAHYDYFGELRNKQVTAGVCKG